MTLVERPSKSKTPSSLAAFLRHRKPELLEQWQRRIQQGRRERRSLDHLPELLTDILRLAEAPPELGDVPQRMVPPGNAETHGLSRFLEGLSLPELVAELALLRDVAFDVLGGDPHEQTLEDLRSLNQAIDRAIASSVERYSAEAARTAKELTTAAEDRARERELITSVLAHDLRTPLSTLLIGAETVRRMIGDHVQILRMSRAVENIAALIRDLIDYGVLRANRFKISTAPCSVTVLLHAAADTVRAQAEEKRISLMVDADSSLPRVVADGARIQQVFTNLCANAIRATPAGGTIVFSARKKDGVVELAVEDTGGGLSPEGFATLFKRPGFDLVDLSGHGLGLLITKAIIDAHGTDIWAERAATGGARFVFQLKSEAETIKTD